jgi:hypothetical protein
MTMQIDKNVPMPAQRPRRSRQRGDAPSRSYLWIEMNIGDSAFFDNEPKATQANPAIAANVWGRTNNAKFAARKEGNGVRIWRVS